MAARSLTYRMGFLLARVLPDTATRTTVAPREAGVCCARRVASNPTWCRFVDRGCRAPAPGGELHEQADRNRRRPSCRRFDVVRGGSGKCPGQALTANELKGLWVGSVSHQGESSPLALDLEPGDDGTASVRLSIPVIHLHQVSLGQLPLVIEGNQVRVGPFALALDRAAGTLRGMVPEHLAPVHELPFTLRRAERYEQPLRPRPTAPVATPVWSYEVGAPLWAGPTVADGLRARWGRRRSAPRPRCPARASGVGPSAPEGRSGRARSWSTGR